MTSSLPEALDAVRAALDDLAASLASGQADAVLAAEAPLALAAERLRACPRAVERPAAVRASIEATRRALARCEALGDSVTLVSSVVFPDRAYERVGGAAARRAHTPAPVER